MARGRKRDSSLFSAADGESIIADVYMVSTKIASICNKYKADGNFAVPHKTVMHVLCG
jgi:hypothetical protein